MFINEVLDRDLGERETIIACQVFVGILDVEAATLSDHVEILSCMKHFLLVFDQENRNHLVTQGEAFLPVLIVKICFNILFLTVLVFFDNKLFEGVLKDTTEDPFLQDLKVRVRSLLEEKSEEVPD